jgi:hypothetical protein
MVSSASLHHRQDGLCECLNNIADVGDGALYAQSMDFKNGST